MNASSMPARKMLSSRLAALLFLLLAAFFVVMLCHDDAFAANKFRDTFEENGFVYEITSPASGQGESASGEVGIKGVSGKAPEKLTINDTLVKNTVTEDAGSVSTYYYKVTSICRKAFFGDTSLRELVIGRDFSGCYYKDDGTYNPDYPNGVYISEAIGESAFEGCTSLEKVTFPSKVAAIGSYAFRGCTSLNSVTFPQGCSLYVNTSSQASAIGSGAFANCTSLKTISIPAITSATRMGDAYHDFDYYNPGTNQTKPLDRYYLSSFAGFWHGGAAPVSRCGFGDGVFVGCTSLKTIVFKAGCRLGSYAYFSRGAYNTFDESCTSLESLVFESAQAYHVNPNGSMQNGTFTDFFQNLAKPADLYYAVDYYVSKENLDADNDAATSRLARTEFKRGTPIDAIKVGDSTVLSNWDYPDSGLYASKPRDGSLLNPDAVARDNGLDTSKKWVWRLDGSQSRRDTLSESCKAYLCEASDISAGRLSSEEISVLYRYCDQSFSQGNIQDVAFDPKRYSSPQASYTMSDGIEAIDAYRPNSPYDDCSFVLESGSLEELKSKFALFASDGSEVDLNVCEFAFQRYDASTDSLCTEEDFSSAYRKLGSVGGCLLMTVKPSSESGYSGELKEWILLKGRTGSVLSRYSTNSSGSYGSWYMATYKSEDNTSTDTYSAPYAVRVGQFDLSSALVGVGIAGLVRAPINVSASNDSSFGFQVSREYSSYSASISGEATLSYPSSSLSASNFAVQSYNVTKRTGSSDFRSRLEVSAEDYPFSDTALLVDIESVNEVAQSAAAFAYANASPVFFTESDGTVSEDTLNCLKDFSRVVLMGSANRFTGNVVSSITNALENTEVNSQSFVYKVPNNSLLSRDVAELLVSEGKASLSTVTVSDAADPFDAIGALNRSGHDGGVTLVSTSSADSKMICEYLYDKRDAISVVRLFGRSEGSGENSLRDGFDLEGALKNLWDGFGGYVSPTIGKGDSIELSGSRFYIEGGSGTQASPFELSYGETVWPGERVAAGTYEVRGGSKNFATLFFSCPEYAGTSSTQKIWDLGLISKTSTSAQSGVSWTVAQKREGNASSSQTSTSAGLSGSKTSGTSSGSGTSTSRPTGSASSGVDRASLHLNTTLDLSESGDGDEGDANTSSSSVNEQGSFQLTSDGTASGQAVSNVGKVTEVTDSTKDALVEAANLGSYAKTQLADEGDDSPTTVRALSVLACISAVLAAVGALFWFILRKRALSTTR